MLCYFDKHIFVDITLQTGISACTTKSTHLGEQMCCWPHVVDVRLRMQTQKYAVGYKNVTANDNFFTGHFPERKIMPGNAAICRSHKHAMIYMPLSQSLMQTFKLQDAIASCKLLLLRPCLMCLSSKRPLSDISCLPSAALLEVKNVAQLKCCFNAFKASIC